MKKSSVPFAQLRQMLRELHFGEIRTDTYWRFDHPRSGAVFLFRPYSADENVTMQDFVSTRKHLDWRGLLSADEFDDALMKAPA
jgi:hypothetical protein